MAESYNGSVVLNDKSRSWDGGSVVKISKKSGDPTYVVSGRDIREKIRRKIKK